MSFLSLAYVGPGLGGGVIAVVVGFLLSIVLAIAAVVWYPIKRLIRALRRGPDPAGTADDGPSASEGGAGSGIGETP